MTAALLSLQGEASHNTPIEAKRLNILPRRLLSNKCRDIAAPVKAIGVSADVATTAQEPINLEDEHAHRWLRNQFGIATWKLWWTLT
jgi:hypothetical protein